MDEKKIKSLLNRYLEGACSAEEKLQVEAWLDQIDRRDIAALGFERNPWRRAGRRGSRRRIWPGGGRRSQARGRQCLRDQRRLSFQHMRGATRAGPQALRNRVRRSELHRQ